MFKTILPLVMATLCLTLSSKAQSPDQPNQSKSSQKQTRTGKVVSAATGETLPGAIIETNNQTLTANNDGEFTLHLPNGNYNLAIHYLSYKAKNITIQIPLKEPLIIPLETEEQNLKEVEINAGYYTVKDKERTGSISRVTAETISKQPVSNPLQALQGSLSGIYIQQTSGIPGSNINVQIRGKSSIDAGNNPLYIVDGIPFGAQSLSSYLSSALIFDINGSSPLNSISPDDIESIEVLKDADATAIYGSRGANGVVLITTKKGKMGKTTATVNVNAGLSKVTNLMKLMNTPQYLQLRNDAFINDDISPGETDYDVNGTWDKNRYTNWQKELIGGTAKFNNVQFSLSGGTEQTQILLSTNYQKQGTVFPGSFKYSRSAVHFSAIHSAFNNKLKATISAIYTGDTNNLFNGDLTQTAIYLSPNAPALYDVNGKLNWENSTWINPLRELEARFKAKGNTLVSNFTLSYQLLKNLTIKTSFGYNDSRLRDYNALPSTYNDPAEHSTASRAMLDLNTTSVQSWIAEPQLDWNLEIGGGKLSILGGMSFQHQQRNQLLLRGIGFSSDALVENIMAASNVEIRDYSNPTYRYEAVFGRVNYNLSGKYIVNLTGRRDGSSRFGPGKQFANFGAIGLAWLFGAEDFISDYFKFLSSGKLRTSYGISGNDQIGDYEYLDLYDSSGKYNGISSLSPSRLFNPDFKWEVSRKMELGLDLGFLNDRILLSLGYYRNLSYNQLVNYPLALTTGFNSIRNNLAAKVQNTGIELEINAALLTKESFSWKTSLNLTVPKNKLLAFPGLESSSYSSQYVIGKSLNIRKVYHSLGINKDTETWQMQDVNGDNKITAASDKKTVMELGQQFYGGLTNTLRYKEIELSFMFQFVKQPVIDFMANYSIYPGEAGNQPANVLAGKATTGSNSIAQTGFSRWAGSDASVTDGSFIRVKNINFAYTFNTSKRLNGLKIYAQAQNLFTLTNYKGLDPEAAGLSLPTLKTITIGAQFTF